MLTCARRLNRHFERKDHHWMALPVVGLNRNVIHVHSEGAALGDVHRKRRLADRRTRGDDYHFRVLEPLKLFIEVRQARRKAVERFSVRVEHRVDMVIALVDGRRPWHCRIAPESDFDKRLLGVAENGLRIGIFPLVVALLDRRRRAVDHRAPQLLGDDYSDVVFGVGGRRRLVDKRLDVCGTANGLKVPRT